MTGPLSRQTQQVLLFSQSLDRQHSESLTSASLERESEPHNFYCLIEQYDICDTCVFSIACRYCSVSLNRKGFVTLTGSIPDRRRAGIASRSPDSSGWSVNGSLTRQRSDTLGRGESPASLPQHGPASPGAAPNQLVQTGWTLLSCLGHTGRDGSRCESMKATTCKTVHQYSFITVHMVHPNTGTQGHCAAQTKALITAVVSDTQTLNWTLKVPWLKRQQ